MGILRKEADLRKDPGARISGPELIRGPSDRTDVDWQLVEHAEFRADDRAAGREEVPIVAMLRYEVVYHRAQDLLARFLDRLQRKLGIDGRILRQIVKGFQDKEVVEKLPHSLLIQRRADHPVDFAFRFGDFSRS